MRTSIKAHFKAAGLALLLLALSLSATPASAQNACDVALACFDVKLSPANLLADFYLDGALVSASVNSARLTGTPNAPHTIEVRNIGAPGVPGYGDLFVYPDQSKANQSAGAGRTRAITFYPSPNYVKGALEIACDPRGRKTADIVACRPAIDGAAQADIAAGAKGTYNLSGGAHTVHIDLVGDKASKWSPASRDDTVTIKTGRSYLQTTRLRASFTLAPKPTPTPTPAPAPGINHLGTEKTVIADYVMWYDPSIFDGTKTWDVPSAGAYNSDDFGTIQRHVAQAQQACLDGFAAHWYGPTDSRTTNNFNSLLAASAGTSLRHAIVIQTNILPGATEQMIIDAISHAIGNWAYGANYLRLGGKPVIVFTDMPRPWGSDSAALAGWTRIRAATDPNHNTIWMAEGLYPTFNPLFDGLYIYRIDHRDYPQSWLKQKRWADGLRAVEKQSGVGLYFADTIAAGFDDTRSVNAPVDLRSDAPHFARDRRGGSYYTDTFAATANTRGDLLFVKSFNEWIEGTEIEAGTTYGDLYLNLTCQYANAYRNR